MVLRRTYLHDNAIEGNTLTRRETALVFEKGITVGGKSLTEHLEATNHADALEWVKKQIGRGPSSLTESDILHIHNIILKGIDLCNTKLEFKMIITIPIRLP